VNGEMVSDQLVNWSDNGEPERILFTKEAPPTRPPTLTIRSRASRLPHRALQTLRKTRVPLCKWTGTRAEVLPIDQSIGSATRDALCSSELSRTSRTLRGQLLGGSANPERDCEHQPRALEASGPFLERLYAVYGSHVGCGHHRLRRSRGLACKHAPMLVAGRECFDRWAGGVP